MPKLPTSRSRSRVASQAWAEEMNRRAGDVARIVGKLRAEKAARLGVDVEDLIQETLLRAWLRGGTPAAWNPNRAAFSTWIVRVADDTLRTEYRRCMQRRKAADHIGDWFAVSALERCDDAAASEEFEAELALLLKREATCSG